MKHNDELLKTSFYFFNSAASQFAVLREGDLEKDMRILVLKEIVIHLHTGIELLLKERLLRAHWALVFADHTKATKTLLKSGDFESISFAKLLNAVSNICLNNTFDIQPMQNLGRQRNKIVHFGYAPDIDLVNKLIESIFRFMLSYAEKDAHISSLWKDELEEIKDWLPSELIARKQ